MCKFGGTVKMAEQRALKMYTSYCYFAKDLSDFNYDYEHFEKRMIYMKI
jgi:hypothetical protein